MGRRRSFLWLPLTSSGAEKVVCPGTGTRTAQHEKHWEDIRARRNKFAKELCGNLGLHVYPSEANFVFVECGDRDASDVQEKLAGRRILVRRFAEDPLFSNALRISIGSEEEMARLLEALTSILRIEN